MKYYEMHEIVYKKLKSENGISWDKSKTFEEMFSHETNVYLKKLTSKIGKSLQGLKVLDLGTGTGTSALFTSMNGADATGVEISESAIAIARDNAKKLNLEANFIVGDVLELSLDTKFDLVIDSTILHCIVGDIDRNKFYQSVKKHLKQDGLFFVNTMLAYQDMTNRFPKEFFLFQDDVLWSLGINEIAERKEIDGKSYFPHRTLFPLERQLLEFETHGFKVIEREQVKGPDEGYDLVALLQLR